jgi:hypothetical protein
MKKQFKYGFCWGSLVGSFLLMAAIALAAIGYALNLEGAVKILLLPLVGKGEVKIPLEEMTGWRVVDKKTRKILRIEHTKRQYEIESRLMSSQAEFDAFVAALRTQAGKKELLKGDVEVTRTM